MTTVVQPELAARIRFVTRLLAYGDPRASSDLPPFMRSRRFLEHLGTLHAADWSAVLRRERVESTVRDAAEQLLRDTPLTPTESIACDVIVRSARKVVMRAHASNGVAPASVPLAARLAVNASVAIVLRDVLPESVFRALYGSFVRV